MSSTDTNPSPPSATAITQAFLAEAERRLIGESLPRLEACLDRLSEEEIWRRPNRNLVSIGNLVLHLCGNARQWIISSLGGASDHRVREAEFSERGPLPTATLRQLLRDTLEEVATTLRTVTPEQLLIPQPVQAFQETPLSIIVHVVEHFSYHTGQVSFATKLLRDTDLGYYSGVDLSKRGAAEP